jgi:hypothetical protein
LTAPNYERNQLLYQYWLDGRTVDEAGQLGGIPRSTVGYRYRKFNRAAKTGVPLHIPPPKPQTPLEAFASVLYKYKVLSQFIESLKSEDPQTTYYRLANFKLLIDVSKYFQLSPDEKKQLDLLIQAWLAANIASHSRNQTAPSEV